MKTSRLLTLACLAFAPMALNAHRMWILPSSTVVSGEDQWVVVDAAVSNNLFFPNHYAPELENFEVLDPTGQPVAFANGMRGKYRTTFDVPLTVKGTYRIFTQQAGIMASWMEGEERKRWRGTMEEFNELDQSKKNFGGMERHSRVETFVTLGAPTSDTFEVQGQGIEFVPVTHPNDLFAGEGASFTFYLDGKPWEGGKITVIPGNDRYRNSVDEIELTTDAQGQITIEWPRAGRYWLEASHGNARGGPDGAGAKAKAAPAGLKKVSNYSAVFEVLPL